LKCLGCGLGNDLAALDCRIDPPTISIRAALPVRLALYSAGDAFVGIATGANDAEIRVEPWSPNATPSSAPALRLIAATASA
jgi:hypothetical protein